MCRRFVDELRAAAASPEPERAVDGVLRRWAGSRVYVPRRAPRRDPTREVAERLVFAGVSRQDAMRILIERRGISARHARRLVALAVAIRGQSVSAFDRTLPAPSVTPLSSDPCVNPSP
jgi:hypothetical protein